MAGNPPRGGRVVRASFEFALELPEGYQRDEEGQDCLMLEAADALTRGIMESHDVRAIRLCGMSLGTRRLI